MTEPRTCVLVVDDEPALAKALEINLRARGYETVTSATGEGALAAMVERHIDAVLLDLGLPDLDGTQVIAGIRAWSQVPIIVLTARQSSDDKVEALDAGADDYVTKPFNMPELLARLRAALRRAKTDDPPPVVTIGDVSIDLARSQVTRAGEAVHLTRTEWRLLETLARAQGALVGQTDLLQQVWGPGYEKETHYLRVYVAGLRRKLEADPSSPQLIVTEPGLGYRLADGSASA